ncbi:MAG TPA: hypothetical protein VF157_02055 [Chloroflexota bacterium]
MRAPPLMTVTVCEYCDGNAELNVGELWLCQVHGNALQEHVGGLEPLLEMSPESRRCVAEAILPRVVRQDVDDQAGVLDEQLG